MNKRFEVRCPALWAEIDNFEESTYEETIKIVKGIGYCNSPDSAKRLENFGYTVKDLYLEKEKEKEQDGQRNDTKEASTSVKRDESKSGNKDRNKTGSKTGSKVESKKGSKAGNKTGSKEKSK